MQNNAFWVVIISPEVPNTVRLAVGDLGAAGPVGDLAAAATQPGAFPAVGSGIAAVGAPLGRRLGAELPTGSCWARPPAPRSRSAAAARVLLGLGDPVGEETDRVSAIWRLRDLARQEGLDAAVWHAGPELLNVYGDLGLTALPLGSDGLPLPESEGDTPLAEQYLVCVAERDLNLLLPVLPMLATGLRRPEPIPV